MSLLSLSTHSATFSRPANTTDAVGGLVRGTYTAQYSSIAGSLQPAPGRIVDEFARRSIRITHTFYTPTALTLYAGDKCVIGSGTYIVHAATDQAGRGRVCAVQLESKD